MRASGIAALLALAASLSHAAPQAQPCDPAVVKAAGAHARLEHFEMPREYLSASVENGGLLVAQACKAWAGGDILAAFAYDAGEPSVKQLVVALVEPRGTRVLAMYQGRIEEDAVLTLGGGSLRLDTARYDLAPGVRAFGLDTETVFSQGCVDGGLGPTRTLFVREGSRIRPVLEGFYVSNWSYVEGGPSCGPDEKVVETIAHTIAIGSAKSRGFANLAVTARRSRSDGKRAGAPAFRYELRYDGTSYPLTTFNGAGPGLDRWRSGEP
jgi:hypothetical protein